ncbi:MAG: GDSL-type esterase/lipase family protein [Clostridia bacterium]
MNKFFKDGQTVLFQGDSITDTGRDREDITSLGNGYPKYVKAIYDGMFPYNKVNFINKGIANDGLSHLLSRYDTDFKEINPDFISILIGINDVNPKCDANSLADVKPFYEKYELLLTKIKKDMPNAPIMIIEPFLVMTDPKYFYWHNDLDPKIQAIRALAKKYADYYLPLDGILTSYTFKGYSADDLTGDGVHPSPTGAAIIANEYLKTLNII